MEETKGFEPLGLLQPLVFKTSAIDQLCHISIMDAPLGLEPGFSGPKPDVLPLDDSAKLYYSINPKNGGDGENRTLKIWLQTRWFPVSLHPRKAPKIRTLTNRFGVYRATINTRALYTIV